MAGNRVNLLAETATRFRIVDDESLVTFFTVNGQKALWAKNRFWRSVADSTANAGANRDLKNAARPDTTRSVGTTLVFCNTPSFRRATDFEHVLRDLGHKVELRKSSAMADLEWSSYRTIIVPGAQPRNDFYPDYVRHTAQLDDFVAQGGTLLLELNGAEGTSIVLPRGVTMKSHGAVENSILAADHPIFAPFSGERLIRANYASHGYLSGVPTGAVILAVESTRNETSADRPTFVEYVHGKGRVIAACQCFHDQDGSGRGPLMATVLDYAVTRPWTAGNCLAENATIAGGPALSEGATRRCSLDPTRVWTGLPLPSSQSGPN